MLRPSDTFKKSWGLMLAGIFFCTSTVAAVDLFKKQCPNPEKYPLAFDSEDLYFHTETGVDVNNVRGFVSGECFGHIQLAGIPIPLPIVVNHITMHVPDLLVNVAAQPFCYLWQDDVKEVQEEIFKFVTSLLFPLTIGGGPVQTKDGLSPTRVKDAEIYANPWLVPFKVGINYGKWGKFWELFGLGKIKKIKKKNWADIIEPKPKKGFYALARNVFPEMTWGCWSSFLPNLHVFNSEIDFFWRMPLAGIDAILKAYPRSIGPGNILTDLLGGVIPAIPEVKMLAPLLPFKGAVTNPVHAHGAIVAALRAAYISTSSFLGLGLLTLHPSQYLAPLPSYLQSCFSTECNTFTSEELKWGQDKAGLWQWIAPQLRGVIPPPTDAMAFPIDSQMYIDYAELVDKMFPPGKVKTSEGTPKLPTAGVNPEEKYSFYNWRCHKCCDIPRGIPGLLGVEIDAVVEFPQAKGCAPPTPDPIINQRIKIFGNAVRKKLAEFEKLGL